jgi:hypothetical protein
MLIMKNWYEDPRSTCIVGEAFKIIEEYLNVEDNLFEENEELIACFDFLRCELDWPWNIKLMLTIMKVKQEEIFTYLLMLFVALF